MFILKIENTDHKCIYCNNSIGYKKLSAKICDNIECIKKRKKDLKNDPIKNKLRNCEICGTDISMLSSLSKICKNPECKKENGRRNYKLHKFIKTCNICGSEFQGTSHQCVCEQCKIDTPLRRKENIKKIKLDVICKDCGKLIRNEIKINTRNSPDIIYELCNDCNNLHKKLIYKEFSERMKTNNPMFNKETSEKVGNTLHDNYVLYCIENGIVPKERAIKKTTIETKEERIERMKTNNPMFNKDNVGKMKLTLQKHILDGTVTYKRGIESPLWKGNRTLNRAIRLSLRSWIKTMFEKYNYTCLLCGKTHTELHVHHIEPLRDIILNFLTKYNYTNDYIQSLEGNNIYYEFVQDIVLYHLNNENIGIVVCPDCHSKIDKYYNKKNKL